MFKSNCYQFAVVIISICYYRLDNGFYNFKFQITFVTTCVYVYIYNIMPNGNSWAMRKR